AKASSKADPAHEADDEPEIASAAPSIPTKASVAKQATFSNAIDLGKTNLIGVYGTQSKRYALVRNANGSYKKVKVGDRIDGGKVAAITDTELRYQKGSRLVVLKLPKG
ncbi:MAG: translation initiation factor 2, partial [Rhodobacteraceae bacterium]|nr:translation initiation factor 2 [Paracoccaceae bacterium]